MEQKPENNGSLGESPPSARSRPARPLIPVRSSDSAQSPVRQPESPAATDADDLVNVPAPSMDVFRSRRKPAAPARIPMHRSIEFRRTIVPILLTFGLTLPILGGSWFATDEDSPFRLLGQGLPLALICIGVMLLGIGLLNVVQLKRELHGRKH